MTYKEALDKVQAMKQIGVRDRLELYDIISQVSMQSFKDGQEQATEVYAPKKHTPKQTVSVFIEEECGCHVMD